MLSTDKQTDRQADRHNNQRYQKHNLLCQGGKNSSKGNIIYIDALFFKSLGIHT